MEIITFNSEGLTLRCPFFTSEEAGDCHYNQVEELSRNNRLNAVIMCPGAFEDPINWIEYAQRLANQGFPTLVMHFTGHGCSDGRRGLVDIKRWAYNIRDAMNALSSLGFQKYALVGWQSGGSASLLAAAHDRRLKCVVVLAVPVQMVPTLGERVIYSLATGYNSLRKLAKKKPLTLSRAASYHQMRFAVDDLVDSRYKSNPQHLEMLKAVPMPESLDSVWIDITRAVVKIKIPTLILHGKEDNIIPIKQSEKLYDLLTGKKKFLRIAESGHVLHLDTQEAEVFISIVRWVKKYLK
jgi:2-hydroxy-6-oxo-octa-2,4-dienoate hydrolase